ncbi:MAG: glycosyltransferase family 39 protein, partial [Thermoanaerobaculia bacterium]
MEQRRVIVVLSLAIALTRLLAIAQSLFDWDEALFALGVRDFDVTQHHPHPPGYPLFIVAAKVLDALGVSEFRSLQVIVVCGSLFVFPALYWLARELGFDFTTAAAGAALYAFLPNVWIYGGTAFSDVPATVFAFVACALLLRGRRDARAYVLGAIVLGIAAGFRLPNLLLGAIPALLATWSQRRRWRLVLLAMFAGACVVLIAYGGAALA